jgi:hypothetical protein
MRSLAATPGLHVERLIGVYCGERSYHFENNVEIWPVVDFINALFSGEIF